LQFSGAEKQLPPQFTYFRIRSKPKRKDARKLRRYKRRWKIERDIAWIANFRWLVVRYERMITMFTPLSMSLAY
jgi:hypothetical protein